MGKALDYFGNKLAQFVGRYTNGYDKNNVYGRRYVHDEYYEYCKMNNIQNFIKISVDYKLKYIKLADIIKEATYEYVLIQYV